MKKGSFILLLILFFHIGVADDSKSIDSALAIKRFNQVIPSPDGQRVAFSVAQVYDDNGIKRWESLIYLKEPNEEIHLISKEKDLAFLPSWSADGKSLAYINQKEKAYLFIYDLKTRKTRELVKSDEPISSFKWAPNGKQIAFVSMDAQSPKASEPIDVETNYQNARLFLVSTKKKKSSPIPLTPEDISISQVTAYTWLDGGFDWAPDSKSIAYSFQPRSGDQFVKQSKIAILHLKDHKAKIIPYTLEHTSGQPLFSPNGQWIAFRTTPPPSEKADDLNKDPDVNAMICVVNVKSMENKCLKNTFNEDPILIGWNPSNDQVYVFDVYKTKGLQIYALSLDPTLDVEEITKNSSGNIESISLNWEKNVFGFSFETNTSPAEAFISSTEEFQLRQVSQLQPQNKSLLGQIKTISWKSPDGLEIEGILITPKNFDPKKRYPLFVGIHGGPEGVWGEHYINRFEGAFIASFPFAWQDILNQGFVMLLPNPRGSTGYGKEFRLAVAFDWGGQDYQDILAGIDSLIEEGIADSDHMAIFGWSYGGYMTSWAITQSNRFKAAIEGAGPVDLISQYGTGDLQRFFQAHLGLYWKSPKLYLERAPIMHVQNIETPTLILQGGNDTRIPVSQGYELYSALKQQKKEVKMLVLPNQGHVPTDAQIIYETTKAVNQWLKKALP